MELYNVRSFGGVLCEGQARGVESWKKHVQTIEKLVEVDIIQCSRMNDTGYKLKQGSCILAILILYYVSSRWRLV